MFAADRILLVWKTNERSNEFTTGSSLPETGQCPGHGSLELFRTEQLKPSAQSQYAAPPIVNGFRLVQQNILSRHVGILTTDINVFRPVWQRTTK